MTTTDLRLWTVDEYYRMTAAGIIASDERVELIEGQIISMSAQNPPHAATTLCTADVLRQLLVGKALIRVQDPIQINLYSEPEPDIAVVRVDPRKYFDRHPTINDIFLLVELLIPHGRKIARLKHVFTPTLKFLNTGFWMSISANCMYCANLDQKSISRNSLLTKIKHYRCLLFQILKSTFINCFPNVCMQFSCLRPLTYQTINYGILRVLMAYNLPKYW